MVRKQDLAPFVKVLIQPTYEKNVEEIKKQAYPFEKDCELISCDVTLPRILGQRSIFPPVAIELQVPSLIGHKQDLYWKKYFEKHEELKSNYFEHSMLTGHAMISKPPDTPNVVKAPIKLLITDHHSPEPDKTLDKIKKDDLSKPCVIMFDNKPDHEGTKYFEKTLSRNEWDYKIIGAGAKWESWRTRMEAYFKELETMNPKKIVVLSDARDVFCVRKSHTFINAFLTYKKPVVVSMELFCFGREEFNPKRVGNCMTLESYWKHNKITPPMRRFCNNGLVAGYAGDLKNIYKWMFDAGYTDDQFGLGNYIINFPDLIAADIEARLLHTTSLGLNAGIQNIVTQSLDAPNLAELNGNAAYFLHVSGQANKGPPIVYKQIKMILESGLVGPGILTTAYGWKEPEFNEVFHYA
jgi:hypothetical protein